MEETYNNFELTSMINDEISDFMDDIGLESSDYEFEYSYDPESQRYIATVTARTADMEEILEVFIEEREEFADHLSSLFPGVTVSLALRGQEEDSLSDYDEISEEEEDEFTDSLYFTQDEDDSSSIDSVELQYEEEGLTILDEPEDDEGIDGSVSVFHSSVDFSSSQDEDEDEDDDPYDSEDESSEYDSYTPSSDDIEDLWSAFGEPLDE